MQRLLPPKAQQLWGSTFHWVCYFNQNDRPSTGHAAGCRLISRYWQFVDVDRKDTDKKSLQDKLGLLCLWNNNIVSIVCVSETMKLPDSQLCTCLRSSWPPSDAAVSIQAAPALPPSSPAPQCRPLSPHWSICNDTKDEQPSSKLWKLRERKTKSLLVSEGKTFD